MSNVTVHTSTTYHDANMHLNDNNKSNARANIYLNGNRNQKQARQDNSSIANKPNDHTTHALSINWSRHNKNNGEDTLLSKLWCRNAHTMTRHSYLTNDSNDESSSSLKSLATAQWSDDHGKETFFNKKKCEPTRSLQSRVFTLFNGLTVVTIQLKTLNKRECPLTWHPR